MRGLVGPTRHPPPCGLDDGADDAADTTDALTEATQPTNTHTHTRCSYLAVFRETHSTALCTYLDGWLCRSIGGTAIAGTAIAGTAPRTAHSAQRTAGLPTGRPIYRGAIQLSIGAC